MINGFHADLTPTNKLPVIVYIHGGAYYSGSANWAGPQFLLDEDVVLVTIQYRLGVWGFLSLDYPEYSGNMGLKDQQMALQWVNDNIHSFGGNREKITIYGHSAGATSVNFHMLAPKSQGLFQRAILSGGSMYNQFAYLSPRVNHTDILLGYLSNQWKKRMGEISEEEIRYWLREGNVIEFMRNSTKSFYSFGLRSKSTDVVWAPVIEGVVDIRCRLAN